MNWWKGTQSGREKWRKETSPGTILSTRYLQRIGLGLNPVLGGRRTVNNSLGNGRVKMFKYTLILTLSFWKFKLGQLIIVIYLRYYHDKVVQLNIPSSRSQNKFSNTKDRPWYFIHLPCSTLNHPKLNSSHPVISFSSFQIVILALLWFWIKSKQKKFK